MELVGQPHACGVEDAGRFNAWVFPKVRRHCVVEHCVCFGNVTSAALTEHSFVSFSHICHTNGSIRS